MQTVPIPVTAVTGEALERRFAQDLRDLTNAAPNIQLEPVGIFQSSPSFYVRGQGTGDIESAADPKVNVFVDGVVMSRVSTALTDFLDVEAVEILRGPQGTLFGRNTTAGAILVRHVAPDLEEFSVSGAVQVGNFGRFDVKGIVNIPIAKDKVAGRIAFKSTNHDGYWRNKLDGERIGAIDHITILPSLRIAPNDRLDIVIRGEYARARDDTNPSQSHNPCRDDPISSFFGIIPGVPPGSGPGGAPDNNLFVTLVAFNNLFLLGQDPVTAAANAADLCGKEIGKVKVSDEYTTWNTQDRGNDKDFDVWGITAEVNYSIPDIGTFTYIGNYRDVEEDMIFDIDIAPLDIFAGRRVQAHFQTTHELRFASEFSERFDFVAGFYYFEQEYTMKQESFGILFGPNVLLGPETFPGSGVLASSFTSPTNHNQAGFSNQSNHAWAVFLDANIHITNKLTLVVGGRYTEETKHFTHCGVGAGNPDAPFSAGTEGCNNNPLYTANPFEIFPGQGPVGTPVFGLMPTFGFDASGGAEGFCAPVITGNPNDGAITCNNKLTGNASWTKFTPRAGLTYDVNDDMMAFFMWSRGWRSGGFNARATTPTSVGPFDPETTDNFEVGVKSEWFENRLRINLNAFHSKTKGSQFSFIRPTEGAGGQETITSNLGSETFKGVELEWSAVPTEGLMLSGSVGFLDVKQSGFCVDADGAFGNDPNNPPPTPGPVSQLLEICGEVVPTFDAVGNFIGWIQPTDNANLQQAVRAPKWTATFAVAYEWMVGNAGSITISADWLYASSSSTTGTRDSESDAFTTDPRGAGVQQFNGDFLSHKRASSHIINAQMVWKDIDDRYRVSFFIKNITNELMLQYVTPVTTLTDIRVPNLRRHWGVEVSFNL